MTIGDRIRYFRTRLGITQGTLAEFTGIHPVSIRKYETNKMQPQAQQIDRIAEALGVSSFAIAGIGNNIRIKTVGDLMGLLIMFCKTSILIIDGTRKDTGELDPSTVTFKINPLISNYFSFQISNENLEANNLYYLLKSKEILEDILRWEKLNHMNEKNVAKYGDTDDPVIHNTLIELADGLEAVEMELQRSITILDISN